LGSRHWPGTAPGPAGDCPSPPAGDPTLITQVKVRTRAKSNTGFSLSKPDPGFETGYRFSGSRLTSLVVSIISFFSFWCFVSVSVCCSMGFMPEIKIYIHTHIHTLPDSSLVRAKSYSLLCEYRLGLRNCEHKSLSNLVAACNKSLQKTHVTNLRRKTLQDDK